MTHAWKIGLLMSLTAVSTASAGPSARIHVEVTNLETRNGNLVCSLFTSSNGFPDGGGARNVTVALSEKPAACDFTDLAPGIYAVSVLHDENRDGKLNKNLFGAPKEGYGVSNNHTYALSSPSFRESKFQLAADRTHALSIKLRN